MRLLNKDPFAQAQRGMHNIVGLVKDQFGRAGGNLPFTYSFAVAFPDCRSRAVIRGVAEALMQACERLGA